MSTNGGDPQPNILFIMDDQHRTQGHKLIQNYNDRLELYDMDRDPQELENIAPEHPTLVHKLVARLRQRFLEEKWLR